MWVLIVVFRFMEQMNTAQEFVTHAIKFRMFFVCFLFVFCSYYFASLFPFFVFLSHMNIRHGIIKDMMAQVMCCNILHEC